MAYNTKKNTGRSYGAGNAYVSGSAARKLYTAAPDIEREQRREIDENERRIREKKINRSNHINFLFTAVVTGVAIVIFSICSQYLQMQTKVMANASEVSRLQSELNELTTANDEMEVQINANIDYESIYNTAINELGMINPKKGQVITFDAGVSEYVKQYGEIPKAD